MSDYIPLNQEETEVKEAPLKAMYISVYPEGEVQENDVPSSHMIIAKTIEDVEERCFDMELTLDRLKIMPWTVLQSSEDDFFLVEVVETASPKTEVYMVSADKMSTAAEQVQTILDAYQKENHLFHPQNRVQEITPLNEPLL